MRGRALRLAAMLAVATALWFVNFKYYPDPTIAKAFYTVLALAGVYAFFRLILEEIVERGITEAKAKYYFRKSLFTVYIAVFALIALAIWVENTQAILVSYGLVGAGVAVALQDFFRSLAGGVAVLIGGLYRPGDRIEINGKNGDVIDINMFYTTLMETREWIAGDQATGRLSQIPNGWVLSHAVNNYSKDHDFIWDEIGIPLEAGADWRRISERAMDLVERETRDATQRAVASMDVLCSKYFVAEKSVAPEILLTQGPTGPQMTVRFVTGVHDRRATSSRLIELLARELKKPSAC